MALGIFCHRDSFDLRLETLRSTTKAKIYQAIARVEVHDYLAKPTDDLAAYFNMITGTSKLAKTRVYMRSSRQAVDTRNSK